MTAENNSTKKPWKPNDETPNRDLAAAADNVPSWRKYRRWDRAEGDLFVPTLRFSPYAWSKLLFLRDLGDTEVGGFGINSEHDLFLIEEVRLIKQSSTWVMVKFGDEAVADFFDEQIDQGLPPERFARCWIHTHPGDCAEPSGTDEETFARAFGQVDWSVMFILARGGETYARLKFGCGPGAEFLVPVAIAWDTPFAGSDHDAWEAEYAQCVRPLASEPIAEPHLRSPELAEFLEAYPDLFDEFGFPFLDYDDPRLEHFEREMARHDNPNNVNPH